MGKRTIIPFGPQHPVLPEPIHLDLVVEDEKVIQAIPSIGFIHRGLEKLVEKKDYVDFVYIAERICGICSFIHGMSYSLAIEEIMKIQVPARAQFLRVIWAEMSRIHSHLLWAGLGADSFGFESLFMHTWRVREKILDIIEATTGGRVIFGSCKIGGVRRDIDNATLKTILVKLAEIEKEVAEIGTTFIEEYSVKHRMQGVAVLSHDDAYKIGAVGPVLRASGWNIDMRTKGAAAYGELSFAPIVETAGDSYARCVVRVRELLQSFDLIRQAVAKIPDGPVDVKVTGNPSGEYMIRTEQPRGEVCYYLKANGTKFLERFRVRTPTFANVPPLVQMLAGCDVADVPIIALTIDPCISCTER